MNKRLANLHAVALERVLLLLLLGVVLTQVLDGNAACKVTVKLKYEKNIISGFGAET